MSPKFLVSMLSSLRFAFMCPPGQPPLQMQPRVPDTIPRWGYWLVEKRHRRTRSFPKREGDVYGLAIVNLNSPFLKPLF